MSLTNRLAISTMDYSYSRKRKKIIKCCYMIFHKNFDCYFDIINVVMRIERGSIQTTLTVKMIERATFVNLSISYTTMYILIV